MLAACEKNLPIIVPGWEDATLGNMYAGRVVETGEVREILRSPKEEYTQVLLSSMLEGKTPMTMLTGNAKEQ